MSSEALLYKMYLYTWYLTYMLKHSVAYIFKGVIYNLSQSLLLKLDKCLFVCSIYIKVIGE